ncbi:MAG: efflux RND transporter permease subunit [Planctomycetota bacterium]
MSLPAFGVKKPVVANLLMFAILFMGFMLGSGLTREFFPEVRPNLITVTAPYPGASPDEVEDALTTKIEDAVLDLDDVVEITSTSSDGVSTVSIEMRDGIDIAAALAEVKREMDALQDLPAESERIVVDKLEPNLPTIVLSLYGPVEDETDERVMKEAIKVIREDLRAIDGVGDMALTGARNDEIRVEVRPAELLRHGLGIDRISDRVAAEMRELPGGTVRGAGSNTVVRTLGKEEAADEIRDIVVKSGGGGAVVRLGEVADVSEGFIDTDVRNRLNGEPAFSITVYKVGDEDAVNMSALVKAYATGLQGEQLERSPPQKVADGIASVVNAVRTTRHAIAGFFGSEAEPPERFLFPKDALQRAQEAGYDRFRAGGVPDGVTIAVTTDLAKYIVGRLDLLTRNAFQGGLLVFATLVLLLNWRISFWVAAGLIVSLAGAIAVMSLVGITLNLLTMFGLIVVIGLLVDDAIVVAENIATRHERGEPALQAAIKGAEEVAWPVVATVLTTISAFLPLALIEGQIGDFLVALPIVVACALSISLIEGLIILPSHMAHSLVASDEAAAKRGWFSRAEAAVTRVREKILQGRVIPAYARFLKKAVHYRYASLAASIAVLAISVGMFRSGRPEFIFFESSDSETLSGEIRMPVGTPAEVTDRYVRRVERVALAQPEISSVFGSVGSYASLDGASGGSAGSHLGQLIVEVKPVELRQEEGGRASPEIIEAIYREVGELPGAELFRVSGVAGGPEGPALNFGITGTNEGGIVLATEEVKALLRSVPGVVSIADDAGRGARELRVTLRDGATELGFTTASIASQVRGYVFGLEPYTFAGDREDVDVRVTISEGARRSLASLEAMHVFTPAGEPVPLLEVARVEEVDGFASINRLDRRQIVNVTADVARSEGANPETINTELKPKVAAIAASYDGVDIIERGRQKENAESFATLPLGMAVASVMIYIVLAWLFSSYVQPLIVMSAIPFAAIGMIWGHLILGYTMTFLSLIGFVALTGVVVNDSLIFMEFYNTRRRAGESVRDACVSAGVARFRAILLTTVTTVLGLSPLMLERSFQAQFLIPMAITISGGLISATAIILLVLPCLLMVFRDLRRVGIMLWNGVPMDQIPDSRAAGLEPEEVPAPNAPAFDG